MTLPASLAHIEYIGDGVTTTFTYPFKLTLGAELEVRVAGVVNTETAQYTTSGVGNDSGGTIIFFIPPGASTVVSLRRVVLFEQLLDLIPNGSLPAEALEGRLDQIVKMVQQLEESLSRIPSLSVGISAALRYLLFPGPTPYGLIGWNAAGTLLTTYPSGILSVTPDPVAGMTFGKSAAIVTASAGTDTRVATGLIPAGVRVLGVTYRCTVTWSTANGLTGVDIGGMGIADGWGSNVGITSGTMTTPGDFRRGDEPIAVSAEDVVITARGGTFGPTGAAKLTVHWVLYTPDA